MKNGNKKEFSPDLRDLLKLKLINKLKDTYRFNSVGHGVNKRRESSAEHSWSCLVLADYFITRFDLEKKLGINRLRVYELLMYHDLVELFSGDTPLHPDVKIKADDKENKELTAALKLRDELPEGIANKFYDLFLEFEKQKTIESRFAKAIDNIDAILQELEHKEDWKGWTESFLREKKEPYFRDFPELMDLFNELVSYLVKNGFLEENRR